jgi:hypothetical protein
MCLQSRNTRSVPANGIKNELNGKGHLVRNITVKHKDTKEPLPLFYVDLEPRHNNKEIFQLQFLQHCKYRVEPPRQERVIAQCTRCQSYGHTEEWLHNVHVAKAMATQKSGCTMYTVPKQLPHKRVKAQCTRCQSYGHTEEWLHNVHVAKAMATQKSDCTMYTVPKLWPHKRVIAQCTRCQGYGHTIEWLHNVHGVKAMATQKSDCTMYTALKLWPHRRVIAQCTRCQSYGHTKEWLHNVHGDKAMATQKDDCTMYTVPKLWPHKNLLFKVLQLCQMRRAPQYWKLHKTERHSATPSTGFLCNGRHPANYKGCMVYPDLVSARNRNNSMYERRSNVRTTLTKQQVSNNDPNNT